MRVSLVVRRSLRAARPLAHLATRVIGHITLRELHRRFLAALRAADDRLRAGDARGARRRACLALAIYLPAVLGPILHQQHEALTASTVLAVYAHGLAALFGLAGTGWYLGRGAWQSLTR